MNAATSNTLGSQIAEAIGMPTHNLVSFTLRFQAGEMVRCDAEYLVDGHDATGITQLIGKSYVAMERTDDKPAHHTTQHRTASP